MIRLFYATIMNFYTQMKVELLKHFTKEEDYLPVASGVAGSVTQPVEAGLLLSVNLPESIEVAINAFIGGMIGLLLKLAYDLLKKKFPQYFSDDEQK